MARDIEKLLDKASPGLPKELRDTELRFHLTRTLPDKIAFQLKLLPKQDYLQTISKARELLLIYQRAADPVNQIHISPRDYQTGRGCAADDPTGGCPGCLSFGCSKQLWVLQMSQGWALG